MQRITDRRSRAPFLVSAAAMAAVFAVPSVASATVATTTIETPASQTVFESGGDRIFGPSATPGVTRVTGTAPEAADGDRVSIVCEIVLYGRSQIGELTDVPAVVRDGRFSVDTAILPPYTCRLRAIPADLDVGPGLGQGLTPAQQAAFTGPRVFGGVFAGNVFGEGEEDPQLFVTYRGQGRGLGLLTATGFPYAILGSGDGLSGSYLLDDVDLRPVFAGAGSLSGFGRRATRAAGGRATAARAAADVDIADVPLVVDGRPAAPTVAIGDERSRTVSHVLDGATGDLTVEQLVPVGFLDETDGETGEPPSAGIRLRRVLVQDHDGRQTTFRDTFESSDGAAHRIEVRYGEGLASDENDGGGGGVELATAPSFRIPWTTGDAFVEPTDGTPIAAAPPGPATVFARGSEFRFSPETGRSAGRATPRAVVAGAPQAAFTFDAAPSDGRFLGPQRFVVRFVRDVPAGGSTRIRHVYSQDATAAGLDELVAEAEGRTAPQPAPTDPVPPLPGSAPLPTTPAPVVPVAPPFLDPTERFSLAARGLLLKPKQGRRVRDGRYAHVIVSRVPAGRYTIAIRRYVKNGRTIASGAVTRSSAGTTKVRVNLSRYGARYFAAKRRSGVAETRVRVEVSYTAPGQRTVRRKKIRTVRFR